MEDKKTKVAIIGADKINQSEVIMNELKQKGIEIVNLEDENIMKPRYLDNDIMYLAQMQSLIMDESMNYKTGFNPPIKTKLKECKEIHGFRIDDQEIIEKELYFRKNRNSKCKCGSGIKVKNCCGKKFYQTINKNLYEKR